jgi:xylose isomerase
MATTPFVGRREHFPGISRIRYEGPESDNPLAFKAYDEDRVVGGQAMREHLRFSICYWHSLLGDGTDVFGAATRPRPWRQASDPMSAAEDTLDATFELATKLGTPFYCFHDRDLAPAGASVAESERNLQRMVEQARHRQRDSGVRLLWGTANVFAHPRYMHGAATNPDFDVVAHAGAQVKAALDATVALEGECYVFWGGREGYINLLNTDTARELEHLARFLAMARDYGRSIGFRGTFLVEPKPMEPTYHQYDFDAQTVIGFLRHHGLAGDFALNIEANHANLAGHSFAHELRMCADAGVLGSIDANRSNPQNGWDTDQFPIDLYETTYAMLELLGSGGFRNGGLNFDAKLRRESVALDDLFHAHIGGMDAFARGLLVAHELLQRSPLPPLRRQRYASFDGGKGKAFEDGELTLGDLRDHAAASGEPVPTSGRQELLENLVNAYLLRCR